MIIKLIPEPFLHWQVKRKSQISIKKLLIYLEQFHELVFQNRDLVSHECFFRGLFNDKNISEMLTMNICLSYVITSLNRKILEAACCCTLLIRTWHGVIWMGDGGKSSEIGRGYVSPAALWLQVWMMESSSVLIEVPQAEWTPRLWTGASVSYAGSTTVLSWHRRGVDKMEDHFEYILYVDC